MRNAELQGRLGFRQQLFEVLGRMPRYEVVVDVDLGFGEQTLGLADFIRGPAVEALGQFAGSHRGVETEPLPQFPAGVLVSFIQG